MSAGMDVRLSADSEIKRLQEMVKRLESRNAQLKSGEVSRARTANNMDPVRVPTGLDDVALLDLEKQKSDEEDSWLYVSPAHAPSPAQKSISPYKYLELSVDTAELNRVRGSLMAKLDSIASQEEAFQLQTESSSPRLKDSKRKEREEGQDRPEAGTMREPSFEEMEEELEELQQLTVRLDYNSPVKRRGAKQIVPQTTEYQENSGTYPRRRGPPTGVETPPQAAWADGSDEELSPVQPRRRGQVPDMDPSEDEKQRTFVRRRGHPAEVDELEKAQVNSQTFVRRRGQLANHTAVNVPDDNEELDMQDSAPVRKRGSKLAAPQPRGGPAVRSGVTMRGQVEEAEFNGPVARRRPSPRSSIAREPVRTDSSYLDDDYGSAQAPAASPRSGDAIPIVTAVRRRQPAAEGRRSLSPQQYSGTPSRRGSAAPRSLKPEDTEVRRRSLPQVPSHVNKSEYFGLKPSGTRTPPRRRGPPNEAGPVPRGSKLMAPRVLTPRGASPQPDDDSGWRDGCF